MTAEFGFCPEDVAEAESLKIRGSRIPTSSRIDANLTLNFSPNSGNPDDLLPNQNRSRQDKARLGLHQRRMEAEFDGDNSGTIGQIATFRDLK